MSRVPTRLGALLGLIAALALLWFPLWITVLTIVVAAQRPDPSVPDGDPCCGHPDTWSEVAEGLAFGTLTGLVTLGPLTVAAACLVALVTGRVPGWVRSRRSQRLALAWLVTFVLAVALFLGLD